MFLIALIDIDMPLYFRLCIRVQWVTRIDSDGNYREDYLSMQTVEMGDITSIYSKQLRQ